VAQVNVLISGGFGGAYEELLPEFERANGIKVATGSGASQGTGPQTIAAQLGRGVHNNRSADGCLAQSCHLAAEAIPCNLVET
jgi:hypothetical protein